MTSVDKQGLRVRLLARRAAIPAAERDRQSRRIASRVGSSAAWRGARTVLLYRSVRDEVATDALFARGKDDGKLLGVPTTHPTGLYPTPVGPETVWRRGPFGVPEPERAAAPAPRAWDLVVVPGVAFDATGHRLGYGKGYYDVFLARGLHNVSVGLCFTELLVDALPAESHDVPVGAVATPESFTGQDVDMFN